VCVAVGEAALRGWARGLIRWPLAQRVDRNVLVGGDLSEADPYVVFSPKPEAPTIHEPGSESLADQQTASLVAGADGSGLIEQRLGIEDLDDLGVRVADSSPSARSVDHCLGRECAAEGGSAGRRQGQRLVVAELVGQSPTGTRTARYSPMTSTVVTAAIWLGRPGPRLTPGQLLQRRPRQPETPSGSSKLATRKSSLRHEERIPPRGRAIQLTTELAVERAPSELGGRQHSVLCLLRGGLRVPLPAR
jgi:hypothetical protein